MKTRERIMHWFVLPCDKITCQMEKQTAGQASFLRRFQITLHLYICECCKIYNKKIELMDKIMQKIINEEKEIKLENFDEHLFKHNLKESIKK